MFNSVKKPFYRGPYVRQVFFACSLYLGWVLCSSVDFPWSPAKKENPPIIVPAEEFSEGMRKSWNKEILSRPPAPLSGANPVLPSQPQPTSSFSSAQVYDPVYEPKAKAKQ